MKKREVVEMDGCKYIEVNDEGLVIERKEGKKSTLEVRFISFALINFDLSNLNRIANSQVAGYTVTNRFSDKIYFLG